jgi:hypothetical protein
METHERNRLPKIRGATWSSERARGLSMTDARSPLHLKPPRRIDATMLVGAGFGSSLVSCSASRRLFASRWCWSCLAPTPGLHCVPGRPRHLLQALDYATIHVQDADDISASSLRALIERTSLRHDRAPMPITRKGRPSPRQEGRLNRQACPRTLRFHWPNPRPRRTRRPRLREAWLTGRRNPRSSDCRNAAEPSETAESTRSRSD